MKLVNLFILVVLLGFAHNAYAQPVSNNLTKEKKETSYTACCSVPNCEGSSC